MDNHTLSDVNTITLDPNDSVVDYIVDSLPDITRNRGQVVINGRNGRLLMRRDTNGIAYEFDNFRGDVISNNGMVDTMRNDLNYMARNILQNGGSIQAGQNSLGAAQATDLRNLSTMRRQEYSNATMERNADRGYTPYSYESDSKDMRVGGCGCRKPKVGADRTVVLLGTTPTLSVGTSRGRSTTSNNMRSRSPSPRR